MDEIIEPYMFSVMYNRNHFDTHQRTNRGVNNLFFELFTQDVTPSYSGFSRKGKFLFDIPEVWNYSYIKEIHEGILDFCSLYYETFQNDPVMFNISGYNAYLPYRFIVRNLAFVKKYFSEFSFAQIVGGDYEHQRLDTIEDLLKKVGL